MVAVSLPLMVRNYAHPKQDLAGAVTLVEAARKPGERVYALGYASTAFRDFFGMDWTPCSNPRIRGGHRAARPGHLCRCLPARVFRRIPELQADRNGT